MEGYNTLRSGYLGNVSVQAYMAGLCTMFRNKAIVYVKVSIQTFMIIRVKVVSVLTFFFLRGGVEGHTACKELLEECGGVQKHVWRALSTLMTEFLLDPPSSASPLSTRHPFRLRFYRPSNRAFRDDRLRMINSQSMHRPSNNVCKKKKK